MADLDDSSIPLTIRKGDVRDAAKKLTWGALGLLASGLIALGGWARNEDARITKHDADIVAAQTSAQEQAVRIAKLEALVDSYHELDTKIAVLNTQAAERDRQMDRIIAMLESRP